MFNGVMFSQYVTAYPVRNIVPNMTHMTAEAMDRQIHLRTKLEPIDIPVKLELRIRETDPVELARLRRLLRSVLYTSKPAKLVLPDDPEVYYMASVVSGDDLDNLWNTGSCTVTFRAFDGVAYGDHKEREIKAGINTIEVGGTWKTYPVMTLKAAGNGVKIENVDTGEYIELDSTTTSGSLVTVDMDGEGIVHVNNNLSPIKLGSIFFPLMPGTNRIRITNANGTIEWDERWL